MHRDIGIGGRVTDHAQFGVRAKTNAFKKKWGVFYTPPSLISALCEWCIRSPNDKILEPSFGGCGFLNASVRQLANLGSADPWANLFGADIDSKAFRFLPSPHHQSGRFLKQNFLSLAPSAYSTLFDAVVGNPPYVSRHNMWDYQKRTALDVKKRQAAVISDTASLWAYFVIHACSFLAVGGRMGWILPRSLTQAFYGKEVLAHLATLFERIQVFSLARREFLEAGAEEATDILLAEGYKTRKTVSVAVSHKHISSVEELKTLQPASEHINTNLPPRASLLSTVDQRHLLSLLHSPEVRALGHIIDVKIGIVTGATKFFILRPSDLRANGLTQRDTYPIVSSFELCPGLEWLRADIENNKQSNRRFLLLKSGHHRMSGRVRQYIQRFPEALRSKVLTFRKRALWYAPDDGLIPDAFLPCLVSDFPRLVLNSEKNNANNNVHRVYFRKGITELQRMISSLSLLSTFGQVMAELCGRVCGSHGLKLDPSEYGGLRILLPSSIDPKSAHLAFETADRQLRASNVDAARTTADGILATSLAEGTYDTGVISILESMLRKLREDRFGGANS